MNTEPQTKKATSAECAIYVENAVKLRSWWKSNKPLNIWKITFLNCRERHKDMIDHQSYPHNVIKAWKKIQASTGFEPGIAEVMGSNPECDDQSCLYKYKPCSFQPGRELGNKRLSHDIYLSNS